MALTGTGQGVPNSNGTGWKITSQQPTTAFGPDGKAADGYLINFLTLLNQPGNVFVPRSMYNPTNVRAAVSAHASELDDVASMTG